MTGTTGFDEGVARRLEAAQARIPLLRAANFSLGVAVLTRLLRQAAAALPDWDLEIVEAHHGRKEDAPSGTALALGEAAAAARGVNLAAHASTRAKGDRERVAAAASASRSCVAAISSASTRPCLSAMANALSWGHRATDRSIFARGALEATYWLAGRAPGGYDLDAMLADRAGS